MTPLALKVTRLAFTSLSALSPTLSGKAAFRLFCRTPSARPKGEKAKAAHSAGAAKLAGAERISLHLAGGARAHAYRLNGGAIGPRRRYLVTHGWGSSMEYMADLVTMLGATGAEVIAVDFPGHGRSGGRHLHMGMAVETIAAARDRFGEFDAAIGHSFGGAALMVSASGLLPGFSPVVPKKLVTIGSPSEMQWLFKDFGKMVGLPAGAQQVLEGEVLRLAGRRLKEFDAARGAGRVDRPLLVIHAEDDKEVDPRHARRYAASGEHVRLLWANGFGHRRIVSAAPVLAAVRDFLLDEARENEAKTDDAEIVPLFEVPQRRVS